ncbi:MAG: hypothetical protein ACE5FA_04630 [Dehalococcoidia bacterium]
MPEYEPHLTRFDVLADDLLARATRELLAERSLKVRILDYCDRRSRITQHMVLSGGIWDFTGG